MPQVRAASHRNLLAESCDRCLHLFRDDFARHLPQHCVQTIHSCHTEDKRWECDRKGGQGGHRTVRVPSTSNRHKIDVSFSPIATIDVKVCDRSQLKIGFVGITFFYLSLIHHSIARNVFGNSDRDSDCQCSNWARASERGRLRQRRYMFSLPWQHNSTAHH